MLNIIEINDFYCSELDIYARYTEAQLLNKDHPEDGMFIAESPKVIGRALDGGYEPVSVLVEKKQIKDNEETKKLLQKFENKEVPILTAEFDVLSKLTGFKLTRGMLCAMSRKKLARFQDMCEGKQRIVILENVMNPTNVGAIFRSGSSLKYGSSASDTGCSVPYIEERPESAWVLYFKCHGHLFRMIMKCAVSGRISGQSRQSWSLEIWVIRLWRLR